MAWAQLNAGSSGTLRRNNGIGTVAWYMNNLNNPGHLLGWNDPLRSIWKSDVPWYNRVGKFLVTSSPLVRAVNGLDVGAQAMYDGYRWSTGGQQVSSPSSVLQPYQSVQTQILLLYSRV